MPLFRGGEKESSLWPSARRGISGCRAVYLCLECKASLLVFVCVLLVRRIFLCTCVFRLVAQPLALEANGRFWHELIFFCPVAVI